MKILGVLIFSISLAAVDRAVAATAFDPMIGIRVGQLVVNGILASPPLPAIAGQNQSARFHVSPIVSSLKVKAGDADYAGFMGSLDGYAAGVGFTRDSNTGLSYYGFATFSETRGGIDQSGLSSTYGTSLRDMKNTAINLSVGISQKFWSERDFPFVLGVLTGPFISSFSSTMVANTNDPTNPGSGVKYDYNYSSESFVFGPMVGLQGYFKVRGLAVNPYFLYYKDMSSPCQTYKTDAPLSADQGWPEAAKSCSFADREIYLDGTFYAYGLNLGWRGFALNVYSNVQKDPDLSSLSLQSYTLSYTFDF